MIQFAYPRAAQRQFALALALSGAAALAMMACSAGVKPTPSGAAGSGGSGPGTGGSQGTAGVAGGGIAGTFSFGGAGGSNGPDAGCQHADYMFKPKIPTAYLLVDRSGSMFHCLTGNTGDAVCATPANTAWSALKEAVRSVVGTLDTQVRFGLATIWGTDPSQGGMCPSIPPNATTPGMVTDNVAPSLNNAAAIMAKYDALAFPPNSTQQGVKFESPASESIKVVSDALVNDPTVGDKYIIFITDGQPDYCDDSNGLCAPDSVIGQLQAAKTAGVTTIVLGVQTALFDLPAGILKAYATAGAGEPTVAPLRSGAADTFAFYDQCNGITGWHNDMVAMGKQPVRGTTIGTYSTTAGPTMPYMPSATDQAGLVTQLTAALSGVKSCIFDLSDVGGAAIKVNLTKLDRASVKIQGTTQPLDASNTNGWNMISDTQLQLFGSACDDWRNPNTDTIAFDFPCDIIVH